MWKPDLELNHVYSFTLALLFLTLVLANTIQDSNQNNRLKK